MFLFGTNTLTCRLDLNACNVSRIMWVEVTLTWVMLNTRSLFLIARNTLLVYFGEQLHLSLCNNSWQIRGFPQWLLTMEEENYSDPQLQIPRMSWTKWAPGKPGLRSSGMALPTETPLRKSVISHFLTAVCSLLRMSALW